MTVMLVDIGNTNTVIALSNNDELDKNNFFRVSTTIRTVDEITILLKNLFDNEIISKIDSLACSSGVAEVSKNFKLWCDQEKINWYSLNINTCNIETKYSNPNEIGSDRIANSISFWNTYKKPGLVVDFGTATTFDVINETGQYCGGLIIPGIEISIQALYENAAGLKHVELYSPTKIVANNTGDAIRSGICFGYGLMIDGIVNQISKEYKVEKVVATGGIAPLIAPMTKSIEEVNEMITVEGLLKAFLEYKN